MLSNALIIDPMASKAKQVFFIVRHHMSSVNDQLCRLWNQDFTIMIHFGRIIDKWNDFSIDFFSRLRPLDQKATVRYIVFDL